MLKAKRMKNGIRDRSTVFSDSFATPLFHISESIFQKPEGQINRKVHFYAKTN